MAVTLLASNTLIVYDTIDDETQREPRIISIEDKFPGGQLGLDEDNL